MICLWFSHVGLTFKEKYSKIPFSLKHVTYVSQDQILPTTKLLHKIQLRVGTSTINFSFIRNRNYKNKYTTIKPSTRGS